MEIYDDKKLLILSNRKEKFVFFDKERDKLYKGATILKKNFTIDLNSKLNQRNVMDKIYNSFKSESENKKFYLLFEKYLAILDKIIRHENKKI